ncbi:MAG TPA: amidoligase family protein [Alphaproteobacteria bacterium]|nr:amidoligase family protein [Alphaproteobacteria bacterium]
MPSIIPLLPPRPVSADGSPRRIGVEIEFAGLDAAETAALVQRLFGGAVEQQNPHRYKVRGTSLGDFTVELDLSAAHPNADKEKPPGLIGGLVERVEETVRAAIGTVGRLIMPHEIAVPPLPVDRLGEADRLIRALRAEGAVGTEANPLYAFGLHLNPEVPGRDAATLTACCKAFALLAPWLRSEIGVNLARRISPFIVPWPDAYVRRLVDPAYRPDLAGLMDDYMDANPTRNRELDLYPLFAHLDPERVAARNADFLIRPRPTFHYRLPDSRVDDPDWSVAADWNRWVAVERLAADAERLDAMGRDYLAQIAGAQGRDEALADWVGRSRQWLAGVAE